MYKTVGLLGHLLDLSLQ